MQILESIGFTHFYGFSPALDLLKDVNPKKDTLNILLSGTSDIRHILKTLTDNCLDTKGIKKINFYFHEKQKEPFARSMVLLEILHMSNLNYKERIELFLDIYGNTLIRQKSQRFVDCFSQNLIRFITEDKKFNTVLKKIIDLKTIKYKEKDDLVDIIKSWHSSIPYTVEKHRDQRLRYILKTRYDYKKNLIDWDYQMGLKDVANIIHFVHYKEWRLTGVAYESGFSSYICPNRTMSSYIPGKNKKEYTSCMVRGFWGDIVISPYIGFGVECDYEDLLFKVANKSNCGHSVEVSEYNLEYYLTMLEKEEEYFKHFTDAYRKKESEEKWNKKQGIQIIDDGERKIVRKEKKGKGKQSDYHEETVEMIPEDQEGEKEEEEEQKKQEKETEEQKKDDEKQQQQEEEIPEKKENNQQVKEPEISQKAQQKEQQLEEQLQEEGQNTDSESQSQLLSDQHSQEDAQSNASEPSTQDEDNKSQTSNSQRNNQNNQAQDNDLYIDVEHQLLKGFEKFDVSISPIFDDLSTMLKKKKWQNFFDIGAVGFIMNGQFANKEFQNIFTDEAIVYGEKNEFLVPMKKEEKEKLAKELVEFAMNGGFRLTSFDKLHHFKFKKAPKN